MEAARNFLESSSIGGFSHISTSKTKPESLFWVVVVVTSIAVTIQLTREAYLEWEKFPISTTIETFPISDARFPNIVVCPPKVRFSFISRQITELRPAKQKMQNLPAPLIFQNYLFFEGLTKKNIVYFCFSLGF